MPNGESRNWIRFLITLESFYSSYGDWPSKIYLYPFFVAELQKKLSSNDFQTLKSKITIIENQHQSFIAFDEVGNRFDYAKTGIQASKDPSIKAIEWLGISAPDYYD
jgi:hypothetical protein